MDSEKLTLKVYRHKIYKDIYLTRGSCCGGSVNAEFYKTTTNLIEAVRNANSEEFEEYMHWFLDDSGITKLKVKATLIKEMDFDGYKGVLKKELLLPVSEFELIVLKEEYNDARRP